MLCVHSFCITHAYIGKLTVFISSAYLSCVSSAYILGGYLLCLFPVVLYA